VQFGRSDDEAHFTVYYRDGQLTINGTGETVMEHMTVAPRAANEVIIGFTTPVRRLHRLNPDKKG
jgi:hypothetical protein